MSNFFYDLKVLPLGATITLEMIVKIDDANSATMQTRRIKCAVFDLDGTLWVSTESFEYCKAQAMVISEQLKRLKSDHGLFIGVASFNHQVSDVIDDLFGRENNLFDIVLSESPSNNYDKSDMLRKVRRAYVNTHPSRKLKWDEMVFYDDNDEVLDKLRQTLPKLRVREVNGKRGVTQMNLESLYVEIEESKKK